MLLALAGYFPKITARPEGFQAPAHVVEVCSVSSHVNKGPDGWIDRWLHNDLFLFKTPEDARVAAGEEAGRFEIFAYRVLAIRFADGQRHEWPPGPLDVAPLPAGYESIGFDAVSRSAGPAFECSPLSCNYLSNEIPVNRYCLVDTLAEAVALAVRFSEEKPEPGDYYVVEVLRAMPLAR
jgi:hypothetical protein